MEPNSACVRITVLKSLVRLENRINHLYRDSEGYVTIGVGHLVSDRDAVLSLNLFRTDNRRQATPQEKQAEYDTISRLPAGNYTAPWFKRHTKLFMKEAEIDRLLEQHFLAFHRELAQQYKKASGYPENFDKLPENIQLALFDMIFNLGATKLRNKFPLFDRAMKAGDWHKAALESHRRDVSIERNLYVANLFRSVALVTP